MEPKDIFVFLAGFVSAWIINFSTHVLQKTRDQKNNFLRISDELRKPFIEAKTIFDPNVRGIDDRCIVEDVFVGLFSDQKRNIHKIIPYIPSFQRKSLQTAWEKYENKINNESPSNWLINNIYIQNAEIIEKRKELISMLDRILLFFDYHSMFSVFRIIIRTTSG